MDISKAKELVLEYIGGNGELLKCTEYKDLYVFVVTPKDFYGNADKLIDCLVSVNKHTDEVRDFKPFMIPIDDYKNGKTITDF